MAAESVPEARDPASRDRRPRVPATGALGGGEVPETGRRVSGAAATAGAGRDANSALPAPSPDTHTLLRSD